MGIPAVDLFKNWAKAAPTHPDFKSYPDQLLKIPEPGNYRLCLWLKQDAGGNSFFRILAEKVERGEELKSQLTETREALELDVAEDEKKRKAWPHVG